VVCPDGTSGRGTSAFSGLPRSTAYRFIDPKNTTLPKNRDQVEAFLRACRLAPQSIIRMLNLWDEVSGNPPQQPPHPDIDNDPDRRYREATNGWS
jgi:hypothetical protein